MNVKRMGFGVFIAVVCSVSLAYAEPTFTLSFDAPQMVEATGGTQIAYEVTGVMTPGNLTDVEPGAQGWSLSMTADGCRITGITVQGTAGAKVTDSPPGLRDTGFEGSLTTEKSEPGSKCEGLKGAVSAVVLSFAQPDGVLPSTTPSTVIKLTIEADVSVDECTTCTVKYVDGCQGAGQPINNVVTHKGNSVHPTTVDSTTQVCPTKPAGCVDGDPCDDGDPCTHTDQCSAGACAGVSYTCELKACEKSSECTGDGSCLVTNDEGDACGDDVTPGTDTPSAGGSSKSDGCSATPSRAPFAALLLLLALSLLALSRRRC